MKSKDPIFLLGEERFTNASLFADKIVTEADRIWSSALWKVERKSTDFLVESKPVEGVFQKSGILIMRSFSILNVNAQDAFDLITSPCGYAILDPVCKPEDHELPPLEVYDWKEGCRLEAALATLTIPHFINAEFVVLNAINPQDRIFVSKSILHDSKPGGSRFSEEAQSKSGIVRAVNTFGVKVEYLTENTCKISLLNFLDLGVPVPSWILNFINASYFKPLCKRLEKKLSCKG